MSKQLKRLDNNRHHRQTAQGICVSWAVSLLANHNRALCLYSPELNRGRKICLFRTHSMILSTHSQSRFLSLRFSIHFLCSISFQSVHSSLFTFSSQKAIFVLPVPLFVHAFFRSLTLTDLNDPLHLVLLLGRASKCAGSPRPPRTEGRTRPVANSTG